MSGLALLVLFLWVGAIVLWLVQAFSFTLGRVVLGWLGFALAGLALLLANHVP